MRADNETTHDQDQAQVAANSPVQERARRLLRRLLAERNLRTGGGAALIGVEDHTLRRMVKGSRAIALGEMVSICKLGGFSLDETFLDGMSGYAGGLQGSDYPGAASAPRLQNRPSTEDSLARVFAAISDLLNPPASPVRPSTPTVAEPTPPVNGRRKRGPAAAAGAKRGRGRPRKDFDPGGLPGPQW
jgi:hypothetical protein